MVFNLQLQQMIKTSFASDDTRLEGASTWDAIVYTSFYLWNAAVVSVSRVKGHLRHDPGCGWMTHGSINRRVMLTFSTFRLGREDNILDNCCDIVISRHGKQDEKAVNKLGGTHCNKSFHRF